MARHKHFTPPTDPPAPVRLPAQGRLPGFTNQELDEIAGVLEHYRNVEVDAKQKMKEVNDREKNRINEAALEVIQVLGRHERKSISIDGLFGEILSTLKVKVKGTRKEPARQPAEA